MILDICYYLQILIKCLHSCRLTTYHSTFFALNTTYTSTLIAYLFHKAWLVQQDKSFPARLRIVQFWICTAHSRYSGPYVPHIGRAPWQCLTGYCSFQWISPRLCYATSLVERYRLHTGSPVWPPGCRAWMIGRWYWGIATNLRLHLFLSERGETYYNMIPKLVEMETQPWLSRAHNIVRYNKSSIHIFSH